MANVTITLTTVSFNQNLDFVNNAFATMPSFVSQVFVFPYGRDMQPPVGTWTVVFDDSVSGGVATNYLALMMSPNVDIIDLTVV